MKKLIVFITFAIITCIFSVFAQQADNNDSVADGKKYQAETDILFQQLLLDSLVKIRLQNDIQNANGNNRKTRELEKKLKKIETEDSLRKLELEKKFESIKKTAKGAAVMPFNDTLFLIYFKIASYNADERAANISNRIIKLYNDPFFKQDSFRLIQTEIGTEIVYNNDLVVMVVMKTDAMYHNKDEFQLANEYLQIIKKSIVAEKKANSLTNLLLRIGKVILIIIGLSLLIFLIGKLFKIINKSISANREKYIKGLTVNKIRVLSAEHLELFILRVSGLLRLLVILLTIYLSLPLLFSIFPETKM